MSGCGEITIGDGGDDPPGGFDPDAISIQNCGTRFPEVSEDNGSLIWDFELVNNNDQDAEVTIDFTINGTTLTDTRSAFGTITQTGISTTESEVQNVGVDPIDTPSGREYTLEMEIVAAEPR